MTYTVISFDLQGTLSDHAFSDEFWLELLPVLYSEHHRVSPAEAKLILRKDFSAMGKYDPRYYCARHWINTLCASQSVPQVFSRLSRKPHLFEEALALVRHLAADVPLIIISTTTRDFIEFELGQAEKHFRHVISTLDDLDTAGKPPAVFKRVSTMLNVRESEILHIGDCKEMDIANGDKAGWSTFFIDKALPVELRFKPLLAHLENRGHRLPVPSRSL